MRMRTASAAIPPLHSWILPPIVNDIYASLAFGTLLVVVGAGMLRWHVKTWRGHQRESVLEERELRHYRHQFRRRMQVGGLLILLGVLIPVGDGLMMLRKQPGLIAGFWIVVLLVTLWMMLLAALDWVSSRAHLRAMRASLAGLERKRRELEAEVDRLRSRGSNGRG
jgi:hypothetical protein